MDDLELLGELRASVAEPDPIALRRARRRLLERAVGVQVAQVRHRRRMAVRVAVAAGLAVVVAGGTVALDGTTRHGRPVTGGRADAATLLRLAADRSIAEHDPAFGPGQYRYVRTRTGGTNGSTQLDDGRWLNFLTDELIEVWIPYDETQDWVRRDTTLGTRFLSKADEKLARDKFPELFAGNRPETSRGPCGLLARPGHIAWSNKDGGVTEMPISQAPPEVRNRRRPTSCDGGDWGSPNARFMAGLPRDPHALLQRIYRESRGHGAGPDPEAFVFIGDLLRSGQVPGDLRAALYRAAAEIPGIQLIDRTANLAGSPGIAVGRDEGGGMRRDLIFDRSTGQFVGEREVRAQAGDGHPAGSSVEFTAVTTTVVDKPGG
jgi:hypothetical protein